MAQINGVLAQPDAAIVVQDVGELVSWLRKNWGALPAGTRVATKVRLSGLRDSGTAQDDVKAYLTQALRRFDDIGDDDDTVLGRLTDVLVLDPENVDSDEFFQLMARADAVWDTLLP